MTEKILITSALLYANGPLHFGHIAGAYLPGDVYARFERLLGNDVLYISGSDEYGVAITYAADVTGRTPKEHVDLYHEINKKLFQDLNFSFDHYSRTTWEGHIKPTQDYFLELLAAGYIEERVTDQLYSEKEQKFLADRYVEGDCPHCGKPGARGDECPSCGASFDATDLKNPRSKLTGSPLVFKPTNQWFLRLDLLKSRLQEWLATKNWKPNVVNFIKKFVDDLEPRAITRDSTWGVPIPLPNTEGKVLYVWFDAPIGYISASMEWAEIKGKREAWKDYWLDPKTKLVHFIGKDNILFHAAIFPAMTMGQKKPYKLVDELPANEFYYLEGKKFSKTEGWYIDFDDFFTKYTSDQLRYAIAASAPETADADFTWQDFQVRCNAELLGKFGNLVNRTLVFADKNCDAKVPSPAGLEVIDTEFLAKVKHLVDEARECYGSFKIRKACQIIMELAQEGNVYFNDKAPWKDAKAPETKQRLANTLFCSLECLKALALISQPIIPHSSDKLWSMLGFKTTLAKSKWEALKEKPIPPGQALSREPVILFRKIEQEEIDEEIKKLKSAGAACTKPQISIDDFDKMDLRVGKIVEAAPVPKSKRLLKLQIDLGFEKRVVVSGISEHYQIEELVGKKVIVVANLAPAKLMGIESRGMVLCAKQDGDLEILTVTEIAPGSSVS